MDYVKDLPAIQKATAQFQKEELEFLQNKLDLTQQIVQAQQSGSTSNTGGNSGQTVTTGPGGAVNVNTSSQQQQRQNQQNQTQQSQSPQAIPVGGGTPPVSSGGRGPTPSPSGGIPTAPIASGTLGSLPVSDRMQNLLDYRQQLGTQITDPRVLFEHMRQRGMVKEGVSGDQPSYSVQVGSKRVSAEDLMASPALQSQALDHLAEQTLPSGNENGGLFRQGRALTGVASNLIRALGPGTSATENVAGVGEAASKIGAMGALGGVADSVGSIALPIGLAAGVLGLVEVGGQAYQSVKNIGQTHNQGFGGGVGYEMGMRMMALNPFITTEQSRQIMMGALNLGYTGKEFDTVTQFMAQNLTDMNMSVADSVNLLNTNVVQGGASILSLGQALTSLQNMSANSTSTNQQNQQNFESYSKNLVSQGVNGNVVNAVALNLAGWNQQKINGQPNPLAGSTSNTLNALTSNPAFLQQLGAQYAPGVEYPGVLSSISGQPGGAANLPQDVQKQLVQIAQRFPNDGSATGKQNSISNFMMYMNALGAGWSEQQATQWYNELTGPTSQLPYQQAQKAATAGEQTSVNAHPYVEGAPNQLPLADDNTQSIQTPSMLNNLAPNPYRGLATFPEEGKYSNPEITSLFQKYGYTNMMVYDPQGKSQPLDFSNKDMMYGLASGSWKLAVKNSAGKLSSPASLDDWRTGLVTPGGSVSSGSGSSGSSSTTAGTFDLTPQAAQLLKLLPNGGTVGTSSNTQAANTGTNGVTPNSSPTVYPSH